jgi:hypothetical protein
MEHKYIILFLTIILILIIFYYEYCYKNIVLEKFETGRWDDDIGLQVLRDMLGVFFDNEKKSFNIPGGISVKEIAPAFYNISSGPQNRLIYIGKFKKGSVDGRLQYEAALLQ